MEKAHVFQIEAEHGVRRIFIIAAYPVLVRSGEAEG
jgi:hypothetical protein